MWFSYLSLINPSLYLLDSTIPQKQGRSKRTRAYPATDYLEKEIHASWIYIGSEYGQACCVTTRVPH